MAANLRRKTGTFFNKFLGILLFALEAVYGNLSLPLRLPSPPEILDPLGFAVLLFCFGYVAVQNVGFSDIRARF
jgi:hypothetical protein